VAYTIENRGKRSFIVSGAELLSGGNKHIITVGGTPDGEEHGTIGPEQQVVVTDKCGERLLKGWPQEIKLLKKTRQKKG
jgi:hypothetical protein